MRAKAFLLLLSLTVFVSAIKASQNGSNTLNAAHKKSSGYRFRLVHAEVPLYPLVAKMARISGTVQIHVTVKGGIVVDAKVTSGVNPLLATTASENVRTWRFDSGATGTFSVTYDYQLEKAEDFPPANPRVEMRLPFFVKVSAVPARPTTQY